MDIREIRLQEIRLVGISEKTSNQEELNPKTAKIGVTLERYFKNNLAEKISKRIKPVVTYCVYTNYATEEKGPYTYFVGEAVNSFEGQVSTLSTLTIPSQRYAELNIGPGKMPEICIKAWQDIWTMSPDTLGGVRSFVADFEVYGEKAKNPEKAAFSIYIGLK